MAQSKIIVGLEMGTTKTCMVVGEIHPDSTAAIIGVGEVPSAGIRKGEIADISMARQCVFDAWQLAQDHSDVEILNVILSVTGEHIYGENGQGSFRLPDDEDIIEYEHIKYAKEKAQKIEIAADRFVINREMGNFSIDNRETSRNPVGLTGRTLDVKCHVMHGILTRIQNYLMCARQVPLEVEDVVFAPLATAQVVLSRQQKEAGALLIDIGGGTSDFICYSNGDIVASGCIPMGGNAINKDIMDQSSQPMTNKAAEVLKCTEGNAFGDVKDTSPAHYRSELGHEVSIPRGLLNKIIRDRLGSILLQVRDHIPPQVLSQSGMTVYLSGGTSLMRGLDNLAQFIFKVPVRQPLPPGTGEEYSYLADPRYCTAIGLIRFAQMYDAAAAGGSGRSWWRRLFNWLRCKR